jgi:hypothetical protein
MPLEKISALLDLPIKRLTAVVEGRMFPYELFKIFDA